MEKPAESALLYLVEVDKKINAEFLRVVELLKQESSLCPSGVPPALLNELKRAAWHLFRKEMLEAYHYWGSYEVNPVRQEYRREELGYSQEGAKGLIGSYEVEWYYKRPIW
jgi:hypothetical protein